MSNEEIKRADSAAAASIAAAERGELDEPTIRVLLEALDAKFILTEVDPSVAATIMSFLNLQIPTAASRKQRKMFFEGMVKGFAIGTSYMAAVAKAEGRD